MARDTYSILEEIVGALEIAYAETGSGFDSSELELIGDATDAELIISPKRAKRKFRVKLEMFYE